MAIVCGVAGTKKCLQVGMADEVDVKSELSYDLVLWYHRVQIHQTIASQRLQDWLGSLEKKNFEVKGQRESSNRNHLARI